MARPPAAAAASKLLPGTKPKHPVLDPPAAAAAAAASLPNHHQTASNQRSKILPGTKPKHPVLDPPAAAAAALPNHHQTASNQRSKILPSIQQHAIPQGLASPTASPAAASSKRRKLLPASSSAPTASLPILPPAPDRQQQLLPAAASSSNPHQLPALNISLEKIRVHLQHDPIVRGGVPDPQHLVSVKHYWSTRQNKVVVCFVPAGAQGSEAIQHHMLTNGAQRFIRSLIQIGYDLKEAELCLRDITSDTFLVDEETGTPVISSTAFPDVVPTTISNIEAEVNRNMNSIADIIESDIISGNPMPLEVGHGLLQMMRTEAYKMMYVLLNDPSLVPLENRIDLQLRLFQQLDGVVEKMSRTDTKRVLRCLSFPSSWRSRVYRNRYLLELYRGGHYPWAAPAGADQYKVTWHRHWGVLKFNRNSSEHGLEKSVKGNVKQYTRPQLAQMLYAVFPLLLHTLVRGLHKVNRLKEMAIDTLFVYRKP